MADQGHDPFDEEMKALRLEVGRFVLRLLKEDTPNNDVLDRVGERLAAQISERARPVSALNADDRRFLEQLSRKVERLDQDVRRIRSTRADAQSDLSSAMAADGGGDAYLGERFSAVPRWLPWAVSGVLAAAVVSMAAFMLLNPGQSEPPPDPAQAPGAVASVDAEARWQTVLATVETWPAEDRAAARRVLCGDQDDATTCPSWAERSAALAENGESRGEVARLVAQALAQSDCPSGGAGSADTDCLLGRAE